MPSSIDLPADCVFQSRCPLVQLENAGGNRSYARWAEGAGQRASLFE